jgi:hypothetical protein
MIMTEFPSTYANGSKNSGSIFREKALGLIHDMDEETLKNKFDAWVWKDAVFR